MLICGLRSVAARVATAATVPKALYYIGVENYANERH